MRIPLDRPVHEKTSSQIDHHFISHPITPISFFKCSQITSTSSSNAKIAPMSAHKCSQITSQLFKCIQSFFKRIQSDRSALTNASNETDQCFRCTRSCIKISKKRFNRNDQFFEAYPIASTNLVRFESPLQHALST